MPLTSVLFVIVVFPTTPVPKTPSPTFIPGCIPVRTIVVVPLRVTLLASRVVRLVVGSPPATSPADASPVTSTFSDAAASVTSACVLPSPVDALARISSGSKAIFDSPST